MGNDLRKDLIRTTKKLEKLLNEFESKEVKKILRKSAAPLRKAARSNIKDAETPVKRYSGGKVVAIYNPGNLRRSIKILTFRRSKFAVFVGPQVGKASSKEYGRPGQPVDGYYAHMVEFGTINSRAKPYMRPAFSKTKSRIIQIAIQKVKEKSIRYKRRNGL